MAVVAVCGRARQGKSFILNQLLLKSSGGGFQVCGAAAQLLSPQEEGLGRAGGGTGDGGRGESRAGGDCLGPVWA